jgi:hypothetical protein
MKITMKIVLMFLALIFPERESLQCGEEEEQGCCKTFLCGNKNEHASVSSVAGWGMDTISSGTGITALVMVAVIGYILSKWQDFVGNTVAKDAKIVWIVSTALAGVSFLYWLVKTGKCICGVCRSCRGGAEL